MIDTTDTTSAVPSVGVRSGVVRLSWVTGMRGSGLPSGAQHAVAAGMPAVDNPIANATPASDLGRYRAAGAATKAGPPRGVPR